LVVDYDDDALLLLFNMGKGREQKRVELEQRRRRG